MLSYGFAIGTFGQIQQVIGCGTHAHVCRGPDGAANIRLDIRHLTVLNAKLDADGTLIARTRAVIPRARRDVEALAALRKRAAAAFFVHTGADERLAVTAHTRLRCEDELHDPIVLGLDLLLDALG